MYRKIILIFLCFLLINPSYAKEDSTWCSLKSNEANLRTGPGKRYPIKWVYQRAHMPFKIVSRYEYWLKIEDFQGTEGWVHPSIVRFDNTFIVTKEAFLKRGRNSSSLTLAKLQKGVIGEIKSCYEEVCKVEIDNWEGYVDKSSIWGNKE